jgi:putative SOS response-associated peptidase YedK
MCGRFTIANPDVGQIAEQFALPNVPQVTFEPRYNVAPTQAVAVVFNDAESKNHLDFMFWGLIPSWSKDATAASKMINARAETVAEKPAFRSALSKRRCLIIADGFYEWKAETGSTKQPMRITLKDGALFGFAGLYERWTEPNSGEMIPTCTIITTIPNGLMAPIHNRMPVIIPRE